jgi:hypothetical protein
MVVGCFLLVEVSIDEGMLTMAGSWWGEKVITPKNNKTKKKNWRRGGRANDHPHFGQGGVAESPHGQFQGGSANPYSPSVGG